MRILSEVIGMKRKLSLIGLVLLLMFLFTACMTPAKTRWKLVRQPDTRWESEDGTITFYVDENCVATGTILINGEEVEICLLEGPLRSVELDVFPIDIVETGITSSEDRYEHWLCSYKSEKRFVATVKNTTYFEEGQKITFHRVDD